MQRLTEQISQNFKLFSDEKMVDFIDGADIANTKKQIKYRVSVFDEYCKQAAIEYDQLSTADLDVLLSKFYAGVRNKSGNLCSKESIQAIRFGLQRHFLKEKGMDITKGNEFPASKEIFKALLHTLKQNGKAVVKKHPPFTKPDMDRIQSILDVQTASGLQNKVSIDTMIYFANRGMENLRIMKPEHFILHTDAEDSREYFSLKDLGTKNHASDDVKSQGGRMYSIPGNKRCLVSTLKRYLERLSPKCEWMWQRAKKKVAESE